MFWASWPTVCGPNVRSLVWEVSGTELDVCGVSSCFIMTEPNCFLLTDLICPLQRATETTYLKQGPQVFTQQWKWVCLYLLTIIRLFIVCCQASKMTNKCTIKNIPFDFSFKIHIIDLCEVVFQYKSSSPRISFSFQLHTSTSCLIQCYFNIMFVLFLSILYFSISTFLISFCFLFYIIPLILVIFLCLFPLLPLLF